MKKLLLSLVLAVGAIAANAQVWVGGSVGYGFQKNGSKRLHEFDLSPTVGFNLSEKWEIGLQFSLGKDKSNTTEETVEKIDDLSQLTVINYIMATYKYSVQPFVRYNFYKTGIVTFFLDGSIGYQFNKQDNKLQHTTESSNKDGMYSYNNTEYKTNIINVGIRPGVKFDVTDHFKLETHLGFVGYSHSSNPEVKSDRFGINASSTTINVGMIYEF